MKRNVWNLSEGTMKFRGGYFAPLNSTKTLNGSCVVGVLTSEGASIQHPFSIRSASVQHPMQSGGTQVKSSFRLLRYAACLLLAFTLGVGQMWGTDKYYICGLKGIGTDGALTYASTSSHLVNTTIVKYNGTTYSTSTDISFSRPNSLGVDTCNGKFGTSDHHNISEILTSSYWGTGSGSSYATGIKMSTGGRTYTIGLGSLTASKITFIGYPAGKKYKISIGGTAKTETNSQAWFTHEVTGSFTGNVSVVIGDASDAQYKDMYGAFVIEIAAPSCEELAAPTGLECVDQSYNTMSFSWDAVTNASSYDVKLWTNSSCTGDPAKSANTTNTTCRFRDLSSSTTYYCKVQTKGDGSTYCTSGGTTATAASGTTLSSTRTFKSGETVFFKDASSNIGTLNRLWVIDGGNVYAYFYNSNDDKNWASGAGAVVRESHHYGNAIYSFTVPKTSSGEDHEWSYVIFTRGTAATWGSGFWNQTQQQAPDQDENMFTISTNNPDGSGYYSGSWSTYANGAAVVGDMNNWRPDGGEFNYSGSIGTVYMDLEANTEYKFKVLDGTGWKGCGGTITNTTTSWWGFNTDEDCTVRTGEAGSYAFKWDNSSNPKTLGIYYPQARLKKGEYIYFDARDNSTWTASDFDARFWFKYYDSNANYPDDVTYHDCAKSNAKDSWVYPYVVPNSDYIGQVQMNRIVSGSWNADANKIAAHTRTSSKQNCIKLNSSDASTSWTTYCPPMSSATLSDNGTTKTAIGSGTEGSPYIVVTGTTIKVSAVAESAVDDDNMTAKYNFKVGGSSQQNSTTTIYTHEASTNNTVYAMSVSAYNNYNSTDGTAANSNVIYYKALDSYTISYSAGGEDGVTGSHDSDTKYYGIDLTLPGVVFSKTGYTQTGWATSKGGDKAYNLSITNYSGNADATLYPVWTANTINVTLAKGTNGAANQAATIKYDDTEYTTFTAVSGNTGYRCTGYYDGETQVLNADGSFAADNVTGYITSGKWTKASDCTLTAHWEGIPYSITYKDEGDEDYSGSNEASLPDTHTYGAATALVPGVKTNYAFAGWYTTDGSTADAISSIGATAYSSNITLYARWVELDLHEPGVYEKPEANDGYGRPLKNKTVSGSAHDYEVYMVTLQDSKGALYAGSKDTIPDGYAMFTTGAATTEIKGDGWVSFYAKSFEGSAGSLNNDEFSGSTKRIKNSHYAYINDASYVRLRVKGYDEFAFCGSLYNPAADKYPDEIFTVKINGASQTLDSYTDQSIHVFRFELDEDKEYFIEVSGITTNSHSHKFRGFSLRLPDVTRYTVSAARNNDSYGSLSASSVANVRTGSTLYVDDNTFTVNGTTVTATPESSCSFVNWTVGGSTPPSTVTGNITMMANFSQSFSVTYNKNGATDGTAPSDATEYESGDKVTVKDTTGCNFVYSGYVFRGWNTENDGSGDYYAPGDKFEISSDTTLYAVWVAGTAGTVTYNLKTNDGSTTLNNCTSATPTSGDLIASATIKLHGDANARSSNSAKKDLTQKLLRESSYDEKDFYEWSCSIASGKVFTPTQVVIKTQGVSGTVNYKLILTDSTTTYTKTFSNTTGGEIETLTWNIPSGVAFAPGSKMYVQLWAWEKSSSESFRLGTPITIKGVVGTAPSYTLTWDLDGGTVKTAGTGAAAAATGTPSSSVAYGTSLTAPIVTKLGYAFAGWDETPATNMPAEDVTYTATWTELPVVTNLRTVNPMNSNIPLAWNIPGICDLSKPVKASMSDTNSNTQEDPTYNSSDNTVTAVGSAEAWSEYGIAFAIPEETNVETVTARWKINTGSVGLFAAIISSETGYTYWEHDAYSNTTSWATQTYTIGSKYWTKGGGGYSTPTEVDYVGVFANDGEGSGFTNASFSVSELRYHVEDQIDIDHVVLMRKAGTAATDTTDASATRLYSGTKSHYTDDEEKTLGVTYYYTAFAVDASGNVSAATTISKTITDDTPRYVTYAKGNESATGDVPTDATVYVTGSTATLAEPGTLALAGYAFMGWSDGTDTYQPGDSYTMPDDDVTFTAQWRDLETTLIIPTVTHLDVTNYHAAPDFESYNVDGTGAIKCINIAGNESADWKFKITPGYYTITVVYGAPGGYSTDVTVAIYDVDNMETPVKSIVHAVNTTGEAAARRHKFYDLFDLTGLSADKTYKIVVSDTYGDASSHACVGYIDFTYHTPLTITDDISLDYTNVAYNPGTVTFDVKDDGNDVTCLDIAGNKKAEWLAYITPNYHTIEMLYGTPKWSTNVTLSIINPSTGSAVYSPSALTHSDGTGVHWYDENTWSNVDLTGLSSDKVYIIRVADTWGDASSNPKVAKIDFTPKKYTLAWNSNGGGDLSGTYTSGSVAAGVAITAPNDPTRDGYTFDGWNSAEDGLGSAPTGTMPMEAVTYYAQWTPKEYTITYKDKGNVTVTGEAMPSTPSTHTYGTATTLKKRSKSGYVFNGWYTDSDCTEGPVTSLGATAVTANVTLYAKWTAMNLTALADNTLYTAQDMVPDGITIGDTRYQPGVSANEKFNILGTGTSSGGTGPMSSATPSTDKTVDGETFTTALYFRNSAGVSGTTIPSHHAIQFEISGAGILDIYCTKPVKMYLIKSGSSAVQLHNSKEGDTKISEDVSAGTYYIYSDEDEASARIFGLKFTPTYRVTYNGNGSDGGSTTASSYDVSGTQITTESCGFTKTGYKFKWWNTAANGSGEDFYVGEKVTLDDADVELFAQWEEVASDEAFWVGDNFTFTDNVMSVGDMRLTKNSVDLNTDITESYNQVSKYSSTAKKAKVMAMDAANEYLQVHFSDGSPINELYLGAVHNGTSDTKKVVVIYSTTADFSSGTSEKKEISINPCDQTSKEPWKNFSPSTEDTYLYARIYVSVSTAVYGYTGPESGGASKMRIYALKAQKGEITGYDITNANPSNGTIAISDGSSAITSAEEDATVHISATPSTGYTFTSWSVTETESGDDVTVTSATTNPTTFTMPGVAVTVDATFTEITHSVSVAAGEHGSVSTSSVSGVGIATASGNITATPATGYNFSSWTLPSGVTAAGGFSSSSNPIQINATADGKTITATYTPISYTITYNLNSGSLDGSQKTSYTIEMEDDYDLPVPTYSGHVFMGWYDNGSFTGDRIYILESGSTGNQAYYAKWGSEVTVVWDIDAMDDKLYKGGGEHTVTAIVDDADWDASGDKDDLLLSASEGIILGEQTTGVYADGTYEGKAYVTAEFAISGDVDGDAITFTLTAPAAGSYGAIEDDEEVDLDACPSGGGSTVYVLGYTNSTGTGYSSGQANKALSVANTWCTSTSPTYTDKTSTDGFTITATNVAYYWVQGTPGFSTSATGATMKTFKIGNNNNCTIKWTNEDLVFSKIKIVGKNTSDKESTTLTVSNDGGTTTETFTFAKGSDVQSQEVSMLFTSGATKGISITGGTKEINVLLELTPYTSSGIATELSWSGSLADEATVNKDEDAADFTYSASADNNSIGAITYTSSNTSVATVNSEGEVHIVGDGSTTITATIAACGCYNGSSISYTLEVENTCSDVRGTVTAENLGCKGVQLTVSGYTAGATIAWWKDGSAITPAATGTTYLATEAGEYYAKTTNVCTLTSNSITLEVDGNDINPTIFADEITVKQDRPAEYRLMQLGEGETISNVANDLGWTHESDFIIDGPDANGIVSARFMITDSDPTGDGKITLTISNGCSSSETVDITIHATAADSPKKIAWLATGTKGEKACQASQSTNTDLYQALEEAGYDMTAYNAYWTVDEAELIKEYSQYDLVILTDYPDSQKGPNSDKNRSKSYTNALGLLIDHVPMLTFEAFVAGCPNWGLSANPTNTASTQNSLTLLCNANDIFGTSDVYNAGTSVTVGDVDDGQALQGFALDAMPNYVFIAKITDGGTDYVTCCERQENMNARMMVFGLNSNVMDAITEAGENMVIGFVEYMLKDENASIPDCSVIFKGTTDSDWSTTSNWEGNSLPNDYASVRLDAACVVADGDVAKAGYVKIHVSTVGDTYTGSLTINPQGTMIVENQIFRVEDDAYTNYLPTEPEDLVIKADEDHTGALIFSNPAGRTQATVQMYSKAYKDEGTYLWQYSAVPLVSASRWNMGDYAYCFNNADGDWLYDTDVYSAFSAVGITSMEETPTTYTFEGALASTTTQRITLYTAAAGNDGYNMVGNSWTAPIHLVNFDEDDFGGADYQINIYNTGHDSEGGAEEESVKDTPGQWKCIPISSAQTAIAGGTWADITVIPSMQGFEVHNSTGSNTTLTLDYDKLVRDIPTSATMNEPMRAPDRNKDTQEIPSMRVTLSDNEVRTHIYLFSGEQFSEGFDNGWDGEYFEGEEDGYAALYIPSPIGDLGISAKPEMDGTMLGFVAGVKENYTFTFAYNGNEDLYLNDLLLEQSTLIDNENEYTFTAVAGENSPRFIISSVPYEITQTPTGVSDLDVETTRAKKILYQDKIYIIRGGRVYSIDGALVK